MRTPRMRYVFALILAVGIAAAASADEPPRTVYVTSVSNYTPEVRKLLAYADIASCEAARKHHAYSTPCIRFDQPEVVAFDPTVLGGPEQTAEVTVE